MESESNCFNFILDLKMFHILQDALKTILKIPKSWQSNIFYLAIFHLETLFGRSGWYPQKIRFLKGVLAKNELNAIIVGCSIWKSSFKFNWIIYDLSRKMQLREFVWVLRSSSVLSIDATDRSQISNDRYRY